MIRDDLFPNDVRLAPPSSPDEAEQRIANARDLRQLAGARFRDIDQLRWGLVASGYNGTIEALAGCGRHITWKAKFMDKSGREYEMLLSQHGEYLLEVSNVQCKDPPPDIPHEEEGIFSGMPHALVGTRHADMAQLTKKLSDMGLNAQCKILMNGMRTTYSIKAISRTGWEYKIIANEDKQGHDGLKGVEVLNVTVVHPNPNSDPAVVKELNRLVKEG